jgi:hypothetical protein
MEIIDACYRRNRMKETRPDACPKASESRLITVNDPIPSQANKSRFPEPPGPPGIHIRGWTLDRRRPGV